MNLKLVVTTMIVAGAISATAFADQSTEAQLDAMKAQIAQMQSSMNANNAVSNAPSTGWFTRISMSGLANVDLLGSTKYAPVGFDSVSPSAIAVSSAALYLDAVVSDWTKAHVGFAYGTSNQNTFNYLRPAAFTSSDLTKSNSSVGLDEVYVTLGNFSKSPFYLKAGKQYMPFGSYTPYADITPSLTQVLEQVNDPGIVTGFVTTGGLTGSAFALQGLPQVTSQRSSIQNYGFNLAINNAYSNIGYNAGVGYLGNMADVTGIDYTLTNSSSFPGNQGYTNQVGAIAANLGVTYSAFDISGKYVTAVKKFSPADLTYNGNGAQPAAWGVDVGYSFPVLAHDSRFSLGYQGSSQSSGLNMTGAPSAPGEGLSQARYLVDYKVNVSKYTDLGFEVRRDSDYSVGNGGTGHFTNTGVARLAVKFA